MHARAHTRMRAISISRKPNCIHTASGNVSTTIARSRCNLLQAVIRLISTQHGTSPVPFRFVTRAFRAISTELRNMRTKLSQFTERMWFLFRLWIHSQWWVAGINTPNYIYGCTFHLLEHCIRLFVVIVVNLYVQYSCLPPSTLKKRDDNYIFFI